MPHLFRSVRYFLFSHYFSDGLQTTAAILLPALFFFRVQNQPDWGLMVGLGALCASITDSPGPLVHKRNGLLVCCGFIFVTAILTGYARTNPWILGLEIGALSFFFALFTVYGNRAAAVGSAGMLIMILTMDRPLPATSIWFHALLILAGGLWYTAISLAFRQFRPYRQAQQALAECIHEIANFLRIKADFYDGRTNLNDDYRRLVAQHVKVSEKQDVVRELLFKSRRMVEETTAEGRALVLTFSDVVDLYEQISAMYYDYHALRQRFGDTGLLNEMARLIRRLVHELDAIGLSIQENGTHPDPFTMSADLAHFNALVDGLAPTGQTGNPLVLKRILVNIRQLTERISTLVRMPVNDPQPTDKALPTAFDYSRFVSHQPIQLSKLRDNLSLSSTTFRYALRMAIACLVGYGVATFWSSGYHSYWILLTITVILKPAYALTRQRNTDRLLGTLAGGLIGVILLVTVSNTTVLFVFMVVFMLGTYSFQRWNYIMMVMFVTPFVLVLLHFMGVGLREVVQERVLDTIIGGLIALAASYGLFPRWESDQVVNHLRDVLRADLRYLQKLADSLSGKPVSVTDYKLARKDLYVQSANLSAAFERMLSEPKSKQSHQQDLLEFAVLNHIFASNIATIVTGAQHRQTHALGEPLLRPLRRSVGHLQEALSHVDPPKQKSVEEVAPAYMTTLPETETAPVTPDEQLLADQLQFIQKLTTDMKRVINVIV
ncbi:MAG: FUSC family protein [Rudanella sp.]|nr:FUSC family protein [Rudanella sp.]